MADTPSPVQTTRYRGECRICAIAVDVPEEGLTVRCTNPTEGLVKCRNCKRWVNVYPCGVEA